MTTLAALDLAAAALRECQAEKSDPDYKRLLREAHDRIQYLRELEMRHGTTLVDNSQPGNAQIVPPDPPILKFAAPVVKPELSHAGHGK